MPKTKQAKALIESLMALQKQEVRFPCPRCGYYRMDKKPTRNALSRRARVYICDTCGREEAMLDAAGKPPLPLNEWAVAKALLPPPEKERT